MRYRIVKRSFAPAGSDPVADDWLARKNAPGVFKAWDGTGATDWNQTAHLFGSVFGQTPTYWRSLLSHYTADPLLPSALRIDSPASTGANGAAYIMSLNDTWTDVSQGMGSTEFWISWRDKIPASRLITRNSNGWKFMDLSQYNPANPQSSVSHPNFEIICENTNWHQIPIMYRETNGSSLGAGQPPFAGNTNHGDIVIQDIDRGSGTNNQRYCLYNGSTYGGNYLAPDDGCFYFVPDIWMAWKMRIKILQYGGSSTTNGNQVDLFGAYQGDTQWTQIYQQSNFLIGSTSDGATNGLNGVWLNTYETNYDGSGTTDTYKLITQFLASTQDIALPATNA